MVRTPFTHIIKFLIITLLVMSTPTYAQKDSTIEASDFDKLCDIYKEVTNKKDNIDSQEPELAEKIQNKLPELFNNLYVYVMRTNTNRRYETIQQYASQQHHINWACEEARTYYATKSKNPSIQ